MKVRKDYTLRDVRGIMRNNGYSTYLHITTMVGTRFSPTVEILYRFQVIHQNTSA